MLETILNLILYFIITPVIVVAAGVVPISLFFNCVAWVDAKRVERLQRKRNANVQPKISAS